MAIIKTLNVSPGTFASVGNFETRAIKGSFADGIDTKKVFATDSVAKRPVINANLLIRTPENTLIDRKNVSVDDTMIAFAESSRVSFPTVTAFNRVTRSYVATHSNEKSNDNLNVSDRKVEPYEKFTGISAERPEILLGSTFQPVFLNGVLTAEGTFIDAQVNSRNLKHNDMVKRIKSFIENDDQFSKIVGSRISSSQSTLNSVSQMTNFLLDLVRYMNVTKDRLDVRDEIYSIDSAFVIKSFQSNFTSATDGINSLLVNANNLIPPRHSIVDNLELAGFDRSKVSNNFSSTKLWMQLLYEYKSIIKDHSLGFLNIKDVTRLNDNNATVIRKNKKVLTFNVKHEDPSRVSSLIDLIKLSPDEAFLTVQIIDNAYHTMYRNATFSTTDDRLVALVNLISKEFSFSQGLSDQNTIDLLQNRYQFTVDRTLNNTNLFDQVLGKFPDNVLDVPIQQLNSLTSLSQTSPAKNVAVLPFENKYIEGDTGTITPGSIWYIDSTISKNGIDTSRIDEFVNVLRGSLNDYSTFIGKINIYQVSNIDSTEKGSAGDLGHTMFDPTNFAKFIAESIIDPNGNTYEFVNKDRIASIFSLANENSTLKATLFLLIMNKIYRSFTQNSDLSSTFKEDNAAFIDQLIEIVIETMRTSTRLTPAHGAFVRNMDTLTFDAIRHAFKSNSSAFLAVVESIMYQVYFNFKAYGSFSSTQRTVYGGHRDSVMMMIVFDMFVTFIASYSNQRISGRTLFVKQSSSSSEEFIIAIDNENFSRSLSGIMGRLQKETATIQRYTWCVIGTIQKMVDTLSIFSSFLHDKTFVTIFNKIASTLNDNDELKMLLTEQQIMALASSVADAKDLFDVSSIDDTEVDNGLEFKLLNEFNVTKRHQDLLYSFLSLPEYTKRSALNKKILTIGIPQDFTRRFLQLSRVANQLEVVTPEKQRDVLKVLVYKIDSLYPDIIFRPRTFLFELSRFPVRDSSLYKEISQNSGLEQILASVPTRDFGRSLSTDNGTSNSVSYFGGDSSNQTFSTSTYDFLTGLQKTELIKNHVISFVLEIYLRLLTGVWTSDQAFKIDEGDVKLIDDEFTRLILSKSVSVPTRTALSLTTKMQFSPNQKNVANLASARGSFIAERQFKQQGLIGDQQARFNVTRTNVNDVMQSLRTVSNISRTLTNLSAPTEMVKSILRPRQFDRVFNLIVDPDDFEIDRPLTTTTDAGGIMFNQLLRRNDILVIRSHQDQEPTYRMREKDVTHGAVSFDRYFVALGTISEK